MKKLLILTLLALSICLLGCSQEHKPAHDHAEFQRDTIYVPVVEHGTIIVHDTVFVEKLCIDTLILLDTIEKEIEVVRVSEILQPDMYDSIQTREILEKSLWSKRIDRNRNGRTIELETRTDLEYLPYYLSLCYDMDNNLPFGFPAYLFVSLCTQSIDDRGLFELGKYVIDNLNTNCGKKHWTIEYPEHFTKGGMETYREYQEFAPTGIDTLRVKTLVYNDWEALQKLEKYYHDKGDDKGIAIYYKVLLGYEGNGDLAERFYKVLEPYFDATPEFRLAVREVLLRAALCDHNARAQELCDSLGFTFCDYRLPLP